MEYQLAILEHNGDEDAIFNDNLIYRKDFNNSISGFQMIRRYKSTDNYKHLLSLYNISTIWNKYILNYKLM